MAVIGTVTSKFLAPGVSANGRLYNPDLIEKAVERMRARLADPAGFPITMLSHHAAGDDSKELCGRVVSCDLDPDTHEATLSGYLIDTRAGRDIAAALEPDDEGRRVLDAVSIRGWWLGPVRRIEYEGQTVQTGDDLEVDGVDFTKSPGISAARISDSTRVTTETAAQTPITESVEATLMSDSRLVYSTSTDATPAVVPPKPGSPAAEAREAAEAAPVELTPEQRLGEAFTRLREAYIEISGWQGPVDLDLSAWGIDNEDIPDAAALMGAAYQAALRVLDPDQDDDLDLPGDTEPEDVTASDAMQECAMCQGEMPGGASFCPTCGAPVVTAQEESAEGADADTTKETEVDKTTEAEATEGAQTGTEEAAATETEATDATAAPSFTLTADDHQAIASALHAKLTAAAEPAPAAEAAPVGLTAEQVTEAIRTAAAESADALRESIRKEVIETYGTPRRKGLAEAAAAEAEKPLHQMSPEEFTRHAGQVWNGVLNLPA